MIELFSDTGMAEIERFVDADTLFAFDLDGTLAPIVDDPTAIELPGPVLRSLTTLSRLAVTAVITGRSRNDALAKLGFQPRYLVGNHGMEGLPGVARPQQELQGQVTGWHQQLNRLLAPQILSGTIFEQKGCSLSLHYRHASDPRLVHAGLLAAIEHLEPTPRRVGGKFVENLLPQGAPHKGDALLQLMAHSGCSKALFVGDDETDEDVFRLHDPRIFSICVGTERTSAADFHLRDQADMARTLEHLINLIRSL
jgi:trehalose 6-phosphate phosphatase